MTTFVRITQHADVTGGGPASAECALRWEVSVNARDANSLIEKVQALPPHALPQSWRSTRSGTTTTMPSITATNFGDVNLDPFQ